MLSRERFAWVWLSALVIIFSAYFAVVAVWERAQPELSILPRLAVLAAALSTLGVVAAGTWFLGWWRRKEEGEMDERDRLIEYRSSAAAYYVLMAGMLVVGCVMPFSAHGWDIVHAALLSIVVAEVVHHGLIVIGYRRGWRV